MAGGLWKKWLWLVIPLGVLCLPLLLVGMMIGSRLLAILMGPVNVWNMTTHAPAATVLAGDYELSGGDGARHLPTGARIPVGSRIRLGADHQVAVTDLPAFGFDGAQLECHYRGTGDWSVFGHGEVTLTISIKVSAPAPPNGSPSCAPTSVRVFYLLGHSPPYRMWYNIGDPEEEQGLLYARPRH